jgi:hypothetical protein
LWLLTLAAVLLLGAERASAQTLIVRNAVPASSVDLLFNGTRLGSTTVGADGTATLSPSLETIGKTQADVRITVDACGALRRILIDENGRPAPPPEGGCLRKPIPDLLVFQKITTVVLELGGDTPLAYIRQGPVPPEWLGEQVASVKRVWPPAPTGLIVSAGFGYGSYTKMLKALCGDAPTCADSARPFERGAAVSYWFSKFAAVEASYVKPPKMLVAGSGTQGASYRFTTDFEADMISLGGRVGGQAGPVRITGFGGASYQWSTITTNQTVDATDTARGGTQSFGFKTQGWGWMAGGGVEHWFDRWVGVYGEGGLISVKGTNPDNHDEGSVDDQMSYFIGGVRVHLGR